MRVWDWQGQTEVLDKVPRDAAWTELGYCCSNLGLVLDHVQPEGGYIGRGDASFIDPPVFPQDGCIAVSFALCALDGQLSEMDRSPRRTSQSRRLIPFSSVTAKNQVIW